MPRRYAKKRGSVQRKRSSGRRTSSRKSSSKVSFAKSVKAIVHRMAENKRVSYNSGTTGIGLNSIIGTNWDSTSVIAVSPYTSRLPITQGTGQGQRIGNRINIRKLTMNAIFVPEQYDAVFNPTPKPMNITMYFLYSKNDPNASPTAAASTSNFFQNSGSSTGITGRLVDDLYKVNTDLWTVKKKITFKLGNAVYNGTGTSPGNQSYANNDYPLNKKISIDLTKHCHKTQKFDDNTSLPSNPVLFCIILLANADGSAVANVSAVIAKMYYTLECQYEDM